MVDTLTPSPTRAPAGSRARRSRVDRARAGAPRYLLVLPALIPLAVIFIGSLVQLADLGLRPYEAGRIGTGVTLDNIGRFAADPYTWRVLGDTVTLGAVCAAVAVALAYPMALALHRLRSPALRGVGLFLIFSPLLTSVVVRAYGWNVMLGDGGVVNRFLLDVGLIDAPLRMMYEFPAVVIAMVHVLLPFAVFPLLGVVAQVPRSAIEAAHDLGANRHQVFWRVTFPLTRYGVVLSLQLCFALTISAFATPALLGGGRVQVLSGLVYTNVGAVDWPMAAVQSYALLLITLLLVGVVSVAGRLAGRSRR
ncbi:ABC transporter permease [Polymorphospora rubra]|uniref:Polyamine ABC transporter permease n=1 Tax=Polymorphospora rubra TaxID=338584 RepID=A0A810NEW9_9ACTN|nr:ABC transporter permease [Polymorphospora rubra]BCJ70013.1 polyamine ABC transporter permease [Polymorphospora rubra]